jgi:hypothetical protein
LTKQGGDLYLLINRSENAVSWGLKKPINRNFVDLVNGRIYTVTDGELKLTVAPFSAMLISAGYR